MRVGRAVVGVVRDHVEDAAAVEQQPRLVDHQDLGGVQRAAGQAVAVDVPEGRGQLDDVVPDQALLEEGAVGGGVEVGAVRGGALAVGAGGVRTVPAKEISSKTLSQPVKVITFYIY